ncbi:MAG: UPF0147 family protein [Candidatus Altiarchaeota archaeon]
MDVDKVIGKIDETLEGYPMPKRVKASLMQIKEQIVDDKQDMAIRVTSAIYELDEIANDVNIQMHAKTALWDIISDLESLKGK